MTVTSILLFGGVVLGRWTASVSQERTSPKSKIHSILVLDVMVSQSIGNKFLFPSCSFGLA